MYEEPRTLFIVVRLGLRCNLFCIRI